MTSDRILYSRAADDITLVNALNNCAGCFSNAVGLFYSPESCTFGKIRGDRITIATGDNLDLDRVFEARIFNEDTELRWLNHWRSLSERESSGRGRAVLLCETTIANYLTDEVPEINAIDIIDSQYLLWGEGTGNKDIDSDWSFISAARIGKIAVPIAGIERNDRVKLKFREYLEVCDEHGNVAVVEERPGETHLNSIES